jgi:hypothetical protein
VYVRYAAPHHAIFSSLLYFRLCINLLLGLSYRLNFISLEVKKLGTVLFFLCPTTCHAGAWGEKRYSSCSFSNLALDGGEWSVSSPGHALAPGKGPHGTLCKGGWVGSRAGLDTEVRGKILSSPPAYNLNRPVVQPVARHYTD